MTVKSVANFMACRYDNHMLVRQPYAGVDFITPVRNLWIRLQFVIFYDFQPPSATFEAWYFRRFVLPWEIIHQTVTRWHSKSLLLPIKMHEFKKRTLKRLVKNIHSCLAPARFRITWFLHYVTFNRYRNCDFSKISFGLYFWSSIFQLFQ